MILSPNAPLAVASVFVFGLLIGSFLNVVIARLPDGRSLIRPRSHCSGCKATLRWYENIPLLSYLALRGKCRSCRTPISARYPLVELMTAALFVAAFRRYGSDAALWVRDFPILASWVAIVFIDLDHRIIPDELSWGGAGLALITAGLVPGLGWLGAFGGFALGFGAFYLLAWGYEAWTGRSGLGGGDIKLLGALGAFLGWSGVLQTILVSSIFGSLIGLLVGATAKGKGELMKTSVPFGPFLIFGALTYYFFGELSWFQFTTPM